MPIIHRHPRLLVPSRRFAPDVLWTVDAGGARSLTRTFRIVSTGGQIGSGPVGFEVDAYTAHAAKNSGVALATSDGAGNGDFTLLAYGAPAASGTDGALVGQGSTSTPTGAWLAINLNSGGGVSSGSACFWTNVAGTTAVSSAGAVNGTWRVFAGVRRGTYHALWIDGTLAASTTGTVRDVDAGNFVVGGYDSSGFVAKPMALAASWNRALSDAELAELGNNPWRLFEPRPNRIHSLALPAASGLIPLVGSGGLVGLRRGLVA